MATVALSGIITPSNVVTATSTTTLTNKTLTTPIISSISNTGTLTLPTSTDTLVGRATTDTLTNKSIAATQLTGTIAVARLPAGSVVQVVNATSTSYANTSSTSYVTTGFSASITPQSNTNKIFILVSAGNLDARGGAGSGVWLTMYRGGTNLSADGFSVCYNGTASQLNFPSSFTLLDSPATTSATTYTMYIKSLSGTSVYWNSYTNNCSITLMEISA